MNFYKQVKIIYIIIIFTSFWNSFILSAQEKTRGTDIFISPRITLGYTFGSGLNYGFDLVLGLYKIDNYKFGLDFTYYMVNTDQGHHRIKGIGIIGEMDYFSIKLEAGAISRRWGLKNVNKASAPGLMIDVTAGIDAYKAPWIGVKSFIFNRDKWEFYDQPSYISAYTYFKSTDIEIFKSKSLNNATQ
jgi:hypothetical protein